jgi:two-component system cell cycle response regulator DivK
MIRTEMPELVLMDIQLPGMDGLAALRSLRANPSLTHIKVVALTANAMKETKETMLQAGFDGYLPKPFHHREFMGMVNSMLENLVSSRGAA